MPDYYTVAPYDAGDEKMGYRPRVQTRDWCVRTRDGHKVLAGKKLTFVEATELAEELNAAKAAQH